MKDDVTDDILSKHPGTENITRAHLCRNKENYICYPFVLFHVCSSGNGFGFFYFVIGVEGSTRAINQLSRQGQSGHLVS